MNYYCKNLGVVPNKLQFVREVVISKTQKTPVTFSFTGVYILVPLGGTSSNRWRGLLKKYYI